jgi:phosphoribosylaminoimidazole (AIR) synthetase
MLSKLFPTWCKIIQQIKNLKREEMYPIFNCGIGMVLVLDARYETILKNNSDLFKIGYLKE